MPKIYKRKCDICGREYKGQGKNFCSKQCYWKWRKGKNIGGFQGGHISYWKTHPITKEMREKSRQTLKEYYKNHISPLKGKPNSKMKGNQYWKLRHNPKGKEHWNWQGGITQIRKQFWDSIKYRKWRKEIFERDNYTCQMCGIKNIFLEVHHKEERNKSWKKYNIKTLEEALNCKELWNKDNGITLCRKCHNLTKKNNVWAKKEK